MTDKDIIKALGYCVSHDECGADCPCFSGKLEMCGDREGLLKQCLDLINRQKAEIKSLTENLEALGDPLQDAHYKIAEQQAEIERLNTSYEVVKQEYDDMLKANRNLMAEVEVLKKIQQKILSKQGDYTTNNATVCEDCEKLWINALLKAKSEAIKEFAENLKEYHKNYEGFCVVDDDDIDNLVAELTVGRENG